MVELYSKLNQTLDKIQVSAIRLFDEEVTPIPDILKLTLGEPDFNTPEHVKTAAKSAIDANYSHYTGMAGDLELRKAVSAFFAKKYKVHYRPENEILVTVGATEAIAVALGTILNPGDKVLVPTPCYPGYQPNIYLNHAEPIYIDTSTNGFVLTPEMIESVIAAHPDEQIKAIILNYPSNPTGVTYLRSEVEAIAETLKKHELFVISDEIYSELTYESNHVSIAEYLPEQTILISGLSKSHAMTGWRVGFLMAPEKLTNELKKIHQYMVTSATTVSQRAGIEALTVGMDDAQVMKKEYRVRRDFVYQKMAALDFEIARPNGAFYIFAKIPAGYQQNSFDFCLALAREGKLAIIPGIAFGEAAEGYVRVSYAADMEKLEEAMRRLARFMERK